MDNQDISQQDAEIIQRVQQGNTSEYIKLVEAYQNRLRSVLSFYCHSGEEIEEFTQEAFVEGFSKIKQFDTSYSFFPWLRTIAVNMLRMEVRRKSTEKRLGAEYLRRIQMEQAEKKNSENMETAHSIALDHCLKKLSSANLRLIREKYQNSRSYAEISDMVDAGENALRTRMARIREGLRKCIEKFQMQMGGQLS